MPQQRRRGSKPRQDREPKGNATRDRQHGSSGVEDVEDFRLRADWFWRTRVQNPDIGIGTLREVGIRHAETLTRFDAFADPVDAEPPPRDGHLLRAGAQRALQIKRVENPDRTGTAGLASPVVEVPDREDVVGSKVAIRLDPELVRRLIPESIRLFHWDLRCLRWIIVTASAVSAQQTFVWGTLHRPGLYAAIGLPADTDALRQIGELYAARPLIGVLDDDQRRLVAESRSEPDPLAGLLAPFRDDPDIGPFLGTPARPDLPMKTRSGEGPAGLPPGFELPDHGLPEFDILDDICPPWRGPRFGPERVPIDLSRIIRPGGILFRPDWVSAGPNNFSGRIKSIAVDPTNASIVYAGAADGGVWKTTNGGATWRSLMVTELSMAIGGLAVAPSNPAVIYAATGEDTPGWGPSYPGVGVYRSTDAGQTWTLSTGVGDRCSRVAVDPGNSHRAFVASNTGLYRTTNGTSWTLSRPGHATDVVVDPTNGSRVFAAFWNEGIFVSTDRGVTWARSGLGITIHILWATFTIGVLPTGSAAGWIKLAMGRNGTGGTQFLVAKMGLDSGELYTTSDGGTAWFPVSGTHQPASYNEWTNMIGVHPNNHGIIVAGGVGLERATNGSSFAGVGGTHSDHQAIAFDPANPSRAFMATDGGVYRSLDSAASWGLCVNGLTATQFYSLGVSQTGSFILGGATQDQGILKTTGSSSWVDTGAGNEGGIFVVDPNDSRNLYVTPWSNNLRRSTDSGATWQDIRTGMTASVGGTTTPPAGVAHIAVRPAASATLVAVGVISNSSGYRSARIFRSTNQGSNWTSRATITGDGTRVAFCPDDASRAYVTTTDGRVYRSTDGGLNWSEPYASGGKPSWNALSALAVDRFDPDILYVGCGGYSGARVLRSLDGGVTWTNVSGSGAGSLPALPVNSLVIDRCDMDTAFVANDIGVFRTTDGGVSWHDFSDGFLFWDVPRIIVTELALRRSTNTLYASTMGRGMFRRQL